MSPPGKRLSPWQARCLADLVAADVATPVVFIAEWRSGGTRPVATPTPLVNPVDDVHAADGLLGLEGVPRITLTFTSDTVARDELDAVRACRTDLILRFGSGPIPSVLAALPRLGVWMYSHGHDAAPDGRPPSLDDVLRGRATTTAQLLRFTADGSHAATLHSGVFSVVGHSLARTVQRVRDGMADWAARACRVHSDVDGGGIVPVRPPQSPSAAELRRLRAVQIRRAARRVLRGLVRHEQWHVAIIDAPVHAYVDGAEVPPPRWIEPVSPFGYLADPFGLDDGGELAILAEAFDYLDWSGRIVALAPTARRGATQLSFPTVIPLEGHASYPYLFRHDGGIYCVPENNVSESVRLFRADDFPTSWSLVAELVTDVAAVDPTVFQHDGRWWLVCTDQSRGENVNLYAYHSPALTGPWEPHRANPVKSDVRSTRPAGTPFVHSGSLYRPAQDCAARYGDAVVINEVVHLSPERYVERPVTRVTPQRPGPFPSGLHTLSAVGDRTLIDGRRDRTLPLALLGRLARAVTAHR